MENTSFKQYYFDRFKLDSRSYSLYFDGKIIEKISKKSLQVLIVLLEKPKQVVSHEEIVEKVWGDNISGVTPNNVAQYILKLRKILTQYQPEKTFIGTGNKRGYIFEESVFLDNDSVDSIDFNEIDEYSVATTKSLPTEELTTLNEVGQSNPKRHLEPKKVSDPYRLKGTKLAGKYELQGYAGGGGMGAVYKALSLQENKIVAVKILKPDVVARSPEYIRLFEQEIEAASTLKHPNIIDIYDSGTEDDISFMVMEWLEGHTLEDEINKGHLELDFVVDAFQQICSALAIAHSQNILHLDIKPANIFILTTPNKNPLIKVIDFGLARILSSETGTTVTRFRGTDKYCSPEQFGGKLTFRSDIYSLGATLLHMLAGVIPFSTSYIQAKIYPNLELPPIPSILINRPNFPEELDKIVQKALSKNPENRHDSVEHLFVEFLRAIGKVPDDDQVLNKGKLDNQEINKGESYEYPPLSFRFIAALLDIILCAGATLGLIALFAPAGFFTTEKFGWGSVLTVFAVFAAVKFVYLTSAIVLAETTFAYRLFSLRIIHAEDGSAVTILEAMLNTIGYLVTLALAGIGLIAIFFSTERRALHDWLSGTVVINELKSVK